MSGEFFSSSEVHHDVCYVRANACFVFVIVWAWERERPSLFLGGASFARCGSVSYAQRFMSYEPQEETLQGLFSVCPDGVRISIHHFWWKWCLYHQYFSVVAYSSIMPIPFLLRNCGCKSAYVRYSVCQTTFWNLKFEIRVRGVWEVVVVVYDDDGCRQDERGIF